LERGAGGGGRRNCGDSQTPVSLLVGKDIEDAVEESGNPIVTAFLLLEDCAEALVCEPVVLVDGGEGLAGVVSVLKLSVSVGLLITKEMEGFTRESTML
jgi:hypothetical protein